VLAIFASADVTIKTVEGTAAVWVQRIIVQEPGISPLGFIQDRFGNYLCGHTQRISSIKYFKSQVKCSQPKQSLDQEKEEADPADSF
jgi:hypothetical protein